MIYAKLQGRIGNIMFITAAAASIARQIGDLFTLVCHKDYQVDNGKDIWEYVQQFRSNILKGIPILEECPSNIPIVHQNGCYYNELDFPEGDFLLEGAFQAYKYIDIDVVQNLFSAEGIISEIIQNNPVAFSGPLTSIHVRRGDYCLIPHKLPPISKSFIKKAMKMFPESTRFIFISDDLDYCKKNFKGENIFYMNNTSILQDMFAPTLCENNIISNSTFCWWGAFLNPNKNKKVILPKPWFGPYAKNSESNVTDLIPEDWIELDNHLDFNLWVNAKKLGLLTRLRVIK